MTVISTLGKVITFFIKLLPIIKCFFPTTLSYIRTDREWFDGLLVHSYRFKISKPRYSRSTSKDPIPLNIPKKISVAEFRLEMASVQTRSVTIPASTLSIAAYDLIGAYLKDVRDGEEITVNLRIPCSSNEIVEKTISQGANFKLYKVRNPNSFPVNSCEIEWPLLLNEIINEIKVIKKGDVSFNKLMNLRKTFSIDFEAGELRKYFEEGISPSDDDWLKIERTNKNSTLKLKLYLDPNEEIEIYLYARVEK